MAEPPMLATIVRNKLDSVPEAELLVALADIPDMSNK